MVVWVALAALLVLAAPSAAAAPRLKGQSGEAQVSEAAAADAQHRLLRQDEAVHFQVVCGLSRNCGPYPQSICRPSARSSIRCAQE
jgi:hypothetical protein